MISEQDLVGLFILGVSIVLNIFQWYRQRLYTRTVYNGVVGTFNSIGWLLARSMNKTKDITERLNEQVADEHRAIAREFRDYSVDTEFSLRQLHEQLVAVAKTLSEKDKRWQAGEFGYTQGQIEKIRSLFTQPL